MPIDGPSRSRRKRRPQRHERSISATECDLGVSHSHKYGAQSIAQSRGEVLEQRRDFLKRHASFVSASDLDDQSFEGSVNTTDPGGDIDLSPPLQPYLHVQRQLEDDDNGICCIETQDTMRYAGHFRPQLIEFTRTRLDFEITADASAYRLHSPSGDVTAITLDDDVRPSHAVLRIVSLRAGAIARPSGKAGSRTQDPGRICWRSTKSPYFGRRRIDAPSSITGIVF